MMLRKFIIAGFIFCLSSSIWGQCTDVPVKEAVRNGDFELGYLPGINIGGQQADHGTGGNRDFEFKSDLNYGGQYNGRNSTCVYQFANQYLICLLCHSNTSDD